MKNNPSLQKKYDELHVEEERKADHIKSEQEIQSMEDDKAWYPWKPSPSSLLELAGRTALGQSLLTQTQQTQPETTEHKFLMRTRVSERSIAAIAVD